MLKLRCKFSELVSLRLSLLQVNYAMASKPVKAFLLDALNKMPRGGYDQ